MGVYPSLMGTFSCVAPTIMINSSLGKASMSLSVVPFRTSHMEDPWTLPSLSTSGEFSILAEIDIPLSTSMVAYQDNLGVPVESSASSSWIEEEDPYALPTCGVSPSHSHDDLDDICPLDDRWRLL